MRNHIISFFRKTFPMKNHRIMQGAGYGALLCAVQFLSPMLISFQLPLWGARLLFFLWICIAAGFLWAGKLFLNLETAGWTIAGYTASGILLSFLLPDILGKVLITGLCGFVVSVVIFYAVQKRYPL